ncbi:MAG: hypothetical protein M0Z75_08820, partial [Nitrospiraceae bacterium]|nr:hypothetical protein [Nitrospiraceae bacterium]
PTTWSELEATAKEIMDAERAAGNSEMWGFVFQGNAYEGLTCEALEWVMSNGGGQIVEPDGTISNNNEEAAAAIDRAAGWVGGGAPEGVLAYQEEESRGVWQLGNAVFMRNWPYAYGLGNGDDMALGESSGGRRAAMAAGAETDPLRRVGGVGPRPGIGPLQRRDVDQHGPGGRLAGKRTDPWFTHNKIPHSQ